MYYIYIGYQQNYMDKKSCKINENNYWEICLKLKPASETHNLKLFVPFKYYKPRNNI